jgi:hypothetical protein
MFHLFKSMGSRIEGCPLLKVASDYSIFAGEMQQSAVNSTSIRHSGTRRQKGYK